MDGIAPKIIPMALHQKLFRRVKHGEAANKSIQLQKNEKDGARIFRFSSILMARCSLEASCHITSGKRAQHVLILSSHRHAIRFGLSQPKRNA